MERIQLLFDHSPWLITVGIALGALYALLLYLRGKHFRYPSWGKGINYALLALRFTLVALLCFLIIGPFIRQIKNTVEEPVVVLAVDNSSSVLLNDSAAAEQIKNQLAEATRTLEAADYQVEIRDFAATQPLDSLQFDYNSSDLNGLLRDIKTDYEGRNLASVVLFSDGIFNKGVSPTYNPYSFTLNTVGLGDTVPQLDLRINNLYYNKVAYQGNKFPIVADVANTGFQNERVQILIQQQGKTLASQEITVGQAQGITPVEFLLEANQAGMQQYVVSVTALQDTAQQREATLVNNQSSAYVEVIEGKENILLLAQSPHPDIKAIKSAVESNKNYELFTVVLSTDEMNEQQLQDKKFDLVILHQLPGSGALPPEVERYQQVARARWYIVGSQTDLPALNQTSQVLTISPSRETDQVSALYNRGFTGFQLDNDDQSVLRELLPLRVPFGNISLENNATPILYQQVGKVSTTNPLLAVSEVEGKKSAVMLAEGMWRWRLQEYAKYENTQAFDGLVTKLVQYLSSKEDKRRFRVYPIQNEFEDTEPVVFETELYNEVYEEVYGESITLRLSGEDSVPRTFTYVTNENNTQYKVSNLPEGVYQYEAKTTLNGEPLRSGGEFTVRSIPLETLNLTADHRLLRQLAQENGGRFVSLNETNQLASALGQQTLQGKIYTSEAFLSIINLKWLFFVLLALITVEWGIRKYMGSY